MNKFHDCFYNQNPDLKVRIAEDDVFSVVYNYVKPSALNLADSLEEVAHSLVSTARQLGKTPCVFYSGGIDSEIIILILQAAGYRSSHDFHCIHGVYDDGQNHLDTEFVDRLPNIEVEKINLIGHDWYRSQECFDYCVKNNISYVTMTQVPRLIEIASAKNLFPIIGHGDPQIYKKNNLVYHCDFEYQNTWAKFVHNNKLNASTHFFRETANLYTNYVRSFSDIVETSTEYPELQFWNHSEPAIKYNIFSFLNMTKRPKFTGHENYRTGEIAEINLRIQKHTKYTIDNKLSRLLIDFTDSYTY